jgi:hypothetical protein
MNDADRFVVGMNHITGKRLTYKELTGKTKDFDSSEPLPAPQPEWEPF